MPYYKRENLNRSAIEEPTKDASRLDASVDSVKHTRQKVEMNKSDPKLLAWNPKSEEKSFASPGKRVFIEKNLSKTDCAGFH